MKQNKLIRSLDTLNTGIVRVETFLMATCTITLVAAIFIEVICRYLLFISTAWSEELARYLFIWLTYIGSAYALNEGGHIEIDVCQQIIAKSKTKYKSLALKVLEIVSILCTVIFLVLFCQIFWGYMMKIFASIQTSPTMRIPMGYVYLPVFVGSVMGIFHSLHHLVNCLLSKPAEQDI